MILECLTWWSSAVVSAGPLFIKEMPGLTLQAGSVAQIPCMYGGFPVDQILWRKSGEDLVSSRQSSRSGGGSGSSNSGKKGRHSVLSNGTLRIEKINTGEDKGQYTCVISNRKGEVASGTVDVNVMRKWNSLLLFDKSSSQQAILLHSSLPLHALFLGNETGGRGLKEVETECLCVRVSVLLHVYL